MEIFGARYIDETAWINIWNTTNVSKLCYYLHLMCYPKD